MSVIVNTTVMSNFARVGQAGLLCSLFTQVFITVEVFDEIRSGLDSGYHFYAGIEEQVYPLNKSGWLHLVAALSNEELLTLQQLPAKLHRGEASSLAVAAHRHWLFLTDDRDARIEAQRLTVRVSGTVGCLLLAVKRGLCSSDDGNAWLRRMMAEGGYRSPVKDLSALLSSGL